MAYPPRAGLLAGRARSQLQVDLDAAQAAYIQLSSGAKTASLSYSQGDGSRSVTYTQANIADLSALIITLQSALKIAGAQRRPVRFNF
jgi:hypothetical protein